MAARPDLVWSRSAIFWTGQTEKASDEQRWSGVPISSSQDQPRGCASVWFESIHATGRSTSRRARRRGDEQRARGLVCAARISLDRAQMQMEDKPGRRAWR
jgi:hypothetical protein